MKCPHCSVTYFDNWGEGQFYHQGGSTTWGYRMNLCPNCRQYTIELFEEGETDADWLRVHPVGASRGPVPSEVPKAIAVDYREAARVMPLSSKASAALSRRCLQTILRAQGYKARDLATEIDLLLKEPDPAKGIPMGLRGQVDAIRNFGNFSAHPITDVTELQVIDVEPHEAEWCLEIIEELFQHFYVRPAKAVERMAALNAKLAAAGKPAAK